MKVNRKGIILAGGFGTRLRPLTNVVSKQLLPVYDKPMIYYPLSTLMLAGINEILIISSEYSIPLYKDLLGSGEQLGMSIQYEIQKEPNGLPEAFIIAEEFLNNNPSALILGDNIFYGTGLSPLLKKANTNANANIFVYRVKDASSYGVLNLDDDFNPKSIEEKPQNPKSNLAVTGLYFFDNKAVEYSKSLIKSSRGELEIVDLVNIYMKQNKLDVTALSRGFAWLDTGTHDHLIDAANFVRTLQKRQGLQIGCIDEIAFRNNWIDIENLYERSQYYKNTEYGSYLESICIENKYLKKG